MILHLVNSVIVRPSSNEHIGARSFWHQSPQLRHDEIHVIYGHNIETYYIVDFSTVWVSKTNLYNPMGEPKMFAQPGKKEHEGTYWTLMPTSDPFFVRLL